MHVLRGKGLGFGVLVRLLKEIDKFLVQVLLLEGLLQLHVGVKDLLQDWQGILVEVERVHEDAHAFLSLEVIGYVFISCECLF